MDRINIAGLEKWAVLKALYDAAKPVGMGFLRATAGPMSEDEARAACSGGGDDHGHRDLYFDYVGGRPLKVDLREDSFDVRLYDRDQGQGAAALVIAQLREAVRRTA